MRYKKYWAYICMSIVIMIMCLTFVKSDTNFVDAYAPDMIEVQTRLQELGYYDGAINGLYENIIIHPIIKYKTIDIFLKLRYT